MNLKAFNILTFAFSAVLWQGCLQGSSSTEGLEGAATIEILNGDTLFVGVPLKLWATFSGAVHDSNIIRWKTGFGRVARRNAGSISAPYYSDTMFVEWAELPPPISPVAGGNNQFVYLDTIQVLVNGVPSNNIAVKIENLFPIWDSLTLENGLVVIPKEDSILFSAQYGSQVTASVYFTDFLKASKISIDWPLFMRVGGQNPEMHPTDSTFDLGVAPTVSFDRSETLTLFDGNGASKQWVLRYRTYEESGSIWVGTPSELFKLSSEGFQLLRKPVTLSETVLMGINRKLEAVYAVDKSQNRIRKFDSRTFREVQGFSISTLELPHNMAVDDEYVWTAKNDISSSANSRLEKYSAVDGKSLNVLLPNLPGKILDMSPDRNRAGTLWFVNSLNDQILLVRGDTVSQVFDSLISHPKNLSYDSDRDVCWISNGSELLMITAAGAVIGRITGFGSIVSVSAGLGKCWVADRFTGMVYMLDHAVTEIRTVQDLAPLEFVKSFRDPVRVSIVLQDEPACWIADLGASSVVKIDEDGFERSRYTGIIAPKAILVN